MGLIAACGSVAWPRRGARTTQRGQAEQRSAPAVPVRRERRSAADQGRFFLSAARACSGHSKISFHCTSMLPLCVLRRSLATMRFISASACGAHLSGSRVGTCAPGDRQTPDIAGGRASRCGAASRGPRATRLPGCVAGTAAAVDATPAHPWADVSPSRSPLCHLCSRICNISLSPRRMHLMPRCSLPRCLSPSP